MLKIKVDRELCDGCLDCQRACESLHEASRITILEYDSSFYSIVCQQCDGEPCSKICPVEAITNIDVDSEKCISCGLCSMVCPFGAITITENTAEKCNRCADREDGPACIQACTKRAISLVDTEKIVSQKQQAYIERLTKQYDAEKRPNSFVNIVTAGTRAKKALKE